jgi:hypothetical protein
MKQSAKPFCATDEVRRQQSGGRMTAIDQPTGVGHVSIFHPHLPRILPGTAGRDAQGASSYLTRVQPVQHYEAYVVGSDGHISMRIDLHCAHEEAAKESARQLVNGHAVELWQRDRRVATFIP